MMRPLCFLFLLLALPLASGQMLDEQLKSEVFAQREAAESALVDWAQGESSSARKMELLGKYFGTQDPEFKLRLFDVLFKIHRQEIPRRGQGALGISMVNGPPTNWVQPSISKGVLIMDIIKNTPAESAGLQIKDLIVSLNGISVAGYSPTLKIKELISSHQPGSEIVLEVLRDDQLHFFTVPLMSSEAMPAEQPFDLRRPLEANPEIDAKALRRDFRDWLDSQKEHFSGTS